MLLHIIYVSILFIISYILLYTFMLYTLCLLSLLPATPNGTNSNYALGTCFEPWFKTSAQGRIGNHALCTCFGPHRRMTTGPRVRIANWCHHEEEGSERARRSGREVGAEGVRLLEVPKTELGFCPGKQFRPIV